MAAPAMLQMTVSRDGTTAYDQFNSSIQDEGSKTHDQYDKEENNNYIRKIFPRGYVSELKALCTLAIPLVRTTYNKNYFGTNLFLSNCFYIGLYGYGKIIKY